MSEIAKYHTTNPETQYPGCRNTGALEDGVVFPGIEPQFGYLCFVGRTSIIEAAGELFQLTPEEVEDALAGGSEKHKAALTRRDYTIRELKAELKRVRATVIAAATEPVESEIQ